jgi:hypothetical protein
MPLIRDFRNYSYSADRIHRCGRSVGCKIYWKLYAIENTIRIVIHSVLTAQFGPNWWTVAVDPAIVKKATKFRANYAAKPKNASPGATEIHLVYLSDLTEILRVNNHLFIPVIPDTNNWIATLEAIRVPRNLVGHMNFPNAYDRTAVDLAHSQLPNLLNYLTTNGVPILVPK